jgi:hypothetical protein
VHGTPVATDTEHAEGTGRIWGRRAARVLCLLLFLVLFTASSMMARAKGTHVPMRAPVASRSFASGQRSFVRSSVRAPDAGPASGVGPMRRAAS